MVRRVVAALGGLVLLAALGIPGAAAAPSDGRSHHYNARGLDSCNAPTHSQMAAFWHQSRWWWWAIYIGGVNRGCPNTNLTAGWIHKELRRGWGLQPIWVGPQAPCVRQSGLARMSERRGRAFKQGRREAVYAYNTVVALNMNAHTPVVYDMEGFNPSNASCLAAVKAFVRGWSYQLTRKPAQVPGYYGSSCGSAVTTMWGISPRPSYVWAASWGTGSKVSRLSCVSTTIWPSRLKQYSGGTRVTQNGVTLSVDKDCADGPMYAPRRHIIGDCT